ncbi:hypothetical protein D9611_011736 [Ephemerocybe angulata]|uniref:Major facilitator superfamily (MFS) profile domain-containing protein n=1 Tax=Ephemerocybe angulata TaxID=980116 RepID=A0A8H5C729_9AGAR|nr:hypothetical protein D9611_011736 [Tulosesus angulatus]
MEKLSTSTFEDREKQHNSIDIPSTQDHSAHSDAARGLVDGSAPPDPALMRRAWMKLDLWLLPVVTMFYFLSFLDRTNLGNARVAGLQKDLKLTNHQYSIALTVTYIPYILAELPSNLLLRVIGPNLLLPTLLTLWGVVTTLQGLVTSYKGLLAARFFLGLFEGGVFPGLVLYLSFFYPRHMLQWRISIFFSAASLSAAFSGLLAFGLIKLHGLGGRPGWAWIFLLEGLFTVLFGLCAFALLPRSPAHARFLSAGEKACVHEALRRDGAVAGAEEEGFRWREVREAFRSVHVWILGVVFFLDGTVLYGLAYFAPSIVQGLGYTASKAQLMTVPPFAAAFVVALLGAYVSDRYRCRGPVAIFACLLCTIGFSMFLVSERHTIQYASLFFSIPGTYLSAPTLSTWCANNSAPLTRRATAIAISFVLTNSGGILATWLLGSLSAAPRYEGATKVMLGMAVGMAVLCVGNWGWLWRENGRKARVRRDLGSGGREEEEKGLGDRSAWFEYAL